jgi:hypothetical protein
MEKESVHVLRVVRGWWLNQADAINKNKRESNEKNGETRGARQVERKRGGTCVQVATWGS